MAKYEGPLGRPDDVINGFQRVLRGRCTRDTIVSRSVHFKSTVAWHRDAPAVYDVPYAVYLKRPCTVSQSPQPAPTAAMRSRRGLRVDGGWVTISSAEYLATTIDRLLDGAQAS
jgi:hypothetical protein